MRETVTLRPVHKPRVQPLTACAAQQLEFTRSVPKTIQTVAGFSAQTRHVVLSCVSDDEEWRPSLSGKAL